jgi:hypothetical protein
MNSTFDIPRQAIQPRETWRLELEDLVNTAPEMKLNRSIRRLPWIGERLQGVRDSDFLAHLNKAVPLIRLARLSLFIDTCLAIHLGDSEKLIQHILRDEARVWSALLSSVRTRRSWQFPLCNGGSAKLGVQLPFSPPDIHALYCHPLKFPGVSFPFHLQFFFPQSEPIRSVSVQGFSPFLHDKGFQKENSERCSGI